MWSLKGSMSDLSWVFSLSLEVLTLKGSVFSLIF